MHMYIFQSLRSISWHHEGKQFMSSHTDGSLLTWNIKSQGKPVSIITPHGKYMFVTVNVSSRLIHILYKWKSSRCGNDCENSQIQEIREHFPQHNI